ncbi:relaxase/mobilization nuclease domain-containing protein [Pseudomonas sp. MAFF 302030]|uniref:Relaxase/mobilization nuclease domain-containing protein n=1 Tax=Pseudomonas morbosilactucae TaxID=2938197 RepID=A0A9X1YYT7_9PSED|nr:relaxase/mobilization nuclease domain-containing protein [Pseudomonas morbosilactucae]MCK9800640.1 relaxase/mobilization nuclease domain-containing protein [Pseudomonas morbosilactucae]
MIRKKLSKLPDSAAMGRTMNYALSKAALVGGSEVKFEGTSIKDYVKLGVKKCDQINNKHDGKTGRKQEVQGLHEMISFDVSDKITPEKAAELALGVWRDVLKIDKHRHRWAVHTDTDKIHVHLIWNKRDNGGKVYEQLHDYALFEKALHKTEIENGLKVVENRNFLKPGMPTNPQPSNEYRLENRGIKSEKTKFKEAVNAATDKAMTAGEFLEFLDNDGFTLITNGNNAYSLEKDGQIFKASEVGASYKALKARFGDDPQFGDTLARLGVKTAPVRDYGSIGGDFHDEQSSITEKRIKKSNRVLDTRFDTPDGLDFFYKGTNKKAFEYDPVAGRADFNTNSLMAIKAGLQKLTESGKPQTLHLSGTDDFKRAAWLQFSMMGLDQKGYSLKGFKPTAEDKEKLEKMKLENSAFKKPIEENNIKALPTEKPDEKPSIGDSAKGSAKEAASTTRDAAVGLLEGSVNAAVDVFTSKDTVGVQSEMLSEMRVLAAQAESKKQNAESEHHQNKRSRLQKPSPH